MKTISFSVIYLFLRFLALFPLRFLYLVSDVFYLIVFHLLGYRKKVVISNLKHAFPEKSAGEIRSIARRFYRHFCDSLFESVKILGISKNELNDRFRFKNPQIFDNLYRSGKSIVLVSGHQGNWEWMIDIQSKIRHKFLAIYKPLADRNFDKLLKRLREKYANGGALIAMDDIYRNLINHRQQQVLTATWFLADQTPPKDYPFWIDFMNRETPFFTGPARIAKKFGQPVVFMQIRKLKRGYYEAEFSLLAQHPDNHSEQELTEMYVRKIEAGIREQPSFWLWTHRRWKHRKKE